ncbi:MAG: hypothetical protein ACREJ3_08795 [Polyangiaceae bacterium]
MPRRVDKTGFDTFFDGQMKSPSFAKSYVEARTEVDAIPAGTRPGDPPSGRGRIVRNRPNRPQTGGPEPMNPHDFSKDRGITGTRRI